MKFDIKNVEVEINKIINAYQVALNIFIDKCESQSDYAECTKWMMTNLFAQIPFVTMRKGGYEKEDISITKLNAFISQVATSAQKLVVEIDAFKHAEEIIISED